MHCWARYLFLVVVAALGILSMVQACGRKGPLYLPEPAKPPAAQAAPQPRPATGSDVPKPPAGAGR